MDEDDGSKVYGSRACICTGTCWRARCGRCGEVVTKHDFERGDALAALNQHRTRAHRSPEEVPQ